MRRAADAQFVRLRLMARPGELVVVQRGIKFKVGLPDGPSRGCECCVPP